MAFLVDRFVTNFSFVFLQVLFIFLGLTPLVSAQSARSLKSVRSIYVGSLGSTAGADELKRGLVRFLGRTLVDFVLEGKLKEYAESKREPPALTSENLAAKQIAFRFYSSERQVNSVTSLLSRAYGALRADKFACFSGGHQRSLYEDIVQNGRIVLVSVSPLDPDAAKILCTLVKCLFQQVVLGPRELDVQQERPVVLACDEFSVIATELPGESVGDGYFFALARQNKCMGLLPTQSVHTLENSSMKEGWRSIYSNFAAKIFMRCADPETAEEACKLAGASEYEVTSASFQSGGDTRSQTHSVSRQERNHLLARQLTSLQQGHGVVIGSLDGSASQAAIQFFHTPRPFKNERKVENG